LTQAGSKPYAFVSALRCGPGHRSESCSLHTTSINPDEAMWRAQAIILSSTAVSLAALPLNGRLPPADSPRELAARSLDLGEWVVGLQGHERTIRASGGANSSEPVHLENDGYRDREYVIRKKFYVRLPVWSHGLGNNLHQLSHAIVYAESERIPRVILPEGGPVRELFDLPSVIHVQPGFFAQSGLHFVRQCLFPRLHIEFQERKPSAGSSDIRQAASQARCPGSLPNKR